MIDFIVHAFCVANSNIYAELIQKANKDYIFDKHSKN